MQDHQALKTIRTEIKSVKDQIVKDQEPIVQISGGQKLELGLKVNGMLWMRSAEAEADR